MHLQLCAQCIPLCYHAVVIFFAFRRQFHNTNIRYSLSSDQFCHGETSCLEQYKLEPRQTTWLDFFRIPVLSVFTISLETGQYKPLNHLSFLLSHVHTRIMRTHKITASVWKKNVEKKFLKTNWFLFSDKQTPVVLRNSRKTGLLMTCRQG